MTGTFLEHSLNKVAQRLYKLRVLRRQALCWILLLVPAIALVTQLPQSLGYISTDLVVLLGITITGLGIARWNVAAPTAIESARLVEKSHPELNDAVLTAVQADERSRNETHPSVLNARVIDEADKLALRSNWKSVIPGRQMLAWSALSFLSFCFLVTSVVAAGRWGHDAGFSNASGSTHGPAADSEPVSDSELTVEPGNVEIERGTALTVVARFGSTLPTDVVLQLKTESGSRTIAMEPTVDAEVFAARVTSVESDATYQVLFGDSVANSRRSNSYTVTTYVRPQLKQVDARITPPAWTGKETRLVEDTVRVTAVEGSTIEFRLHLNKPVVIAELRSTDDSIIPLRLVDSETDIVAATVEAADNQKYRVYLEDEQGRTALEEETIHLRVTRNKRPKIKVTFPGRDTSISALQEFQIEAEARDDFGLTDFGVTYTLSNGTSEEISLGSETSLLPIGEEGARRADEGAEPSSTSQRVKPPEEATPHPLPLKGERGQRQGVQRQETQQRAAAAEPTIGAPKEVHIQHMIDMEQLNASPDQLLSYSFYVEDVASDGTIRRTYSDMMLAEVRRFEEIFRETQQQGKPSKPKKQGRQKTDELLKLQRQIMIATWNIQRTLNEAQSRKKVKSKAINDADVVLHSQQAAIEQLQEVKAEAAGDPEMSTLAEAVETNMQQAVEALTAFKSRTSLLPRGGEGARRADEGAEPLSASQPEKRSEEATPHPNPLPLKRERGQSQRGARLEAALAAEQSAIAGLMRMRAREHNVQKGKPRKGKGQNSASQKQLQQLELDNDRQRYESERQARQQQEQNSDQSAQLQILNRLKELARRQQMLNERLKQLQSELRVAETPKAKAEIERELKRLREEQRDMLRDVDELRETMDQQSAQQQQENQQTREQVEQTRNRVQQAARAMEEGKLSDAISEGTRAERDFNKLQEEFRNRTSNQFSEAMKDLRQQTRKMQTRQKEIARELTGRNDSSDEADGERRKPSLRSNKDRERLQKKVAQQRDDLQRVLEQAKQLVEKAEESEPLLSRRLYDTVRNVRNKRPEEALEATEILVSRGLYDQGQRAEKIARDGVDSLAEGIAKAADAVLGSEAESLRRAQEEIEDLAKQLSSEIAQATGEQKNGAGQSPGQGPPSKQPSAQPSAQNRPPGRPGFLMNGGRKAKDGGRGTSQGKPLTGDDYRTWSNRMREVEEILDDSELRNRVAQVRDRARSIRADFRRHGTQPQWDLVKSQLLDEMNDLRLRIKEELRKIESDRSMVPIDREPVPEEFDELVRRYYELLGQSHEEE